MAAHDPERRRQAARLAALSRWSRITDDAARSAATAPGRAASPMSIEHWVDKLGNEKAADAAHKAHMLRMSLRPRRSP